MRLRSSSFRQWTRDAHLYAGLFISPFVLLYAVSAVLLNHAIMPWGGRSALPAGRHTVRIAVRDTENSLSVAAQVRQQIGVPGEIGFVSRKPGSQPVDFPLETPGHTASVRVDLSTGVATVEYKKLVCGTV